MAPFFASNLIPLDQLLDVSVVLPLQLNDRLMDVLQTQEDRDNN